jgi:hypothetical protein
MMSGIVRPECNDGHPAPRPCRILQEPGLYPQIHACAAEARSGEGRQPAFFELLPGGVYS